MKGEHIHILEELKIPGGACDGINDPQKGFVIRGGREMENHFECLWDLFRSIPSIETEGVSVLDEYYWLNKHDPNYSLMRATVNRGGRRPHRRQIRPVGEGVPTDHQAVSDQGRRPL